MILAIAWFFVIGLPAALLLDRDTTWRRLLGSAFLLGAGIVPLILLALPRWNRVNVTIACCIVAIVLGAPASRRLMRRRPAGARPHLIASLIDLVTLLFVIAHGALATAARVGVWDFWAVWGLKARVFFERGGIDWAYLEHPYNLFSHPDYPPLVPFDYVFVALHDGAWNDRWIGLLTTLFAFALLLIVRDCFAEELPPIGAALATLALAAIPLTQWIGMAEAQMIAYGTAAVLLLRRGSIPIGAVLLGFAALAKNEGLTLIVAVWTAAALAAALPGDKSKSSWRYRSPNRLWPALAINIPWLVLRAMHALPTDLASGDVLTRSAQHVTRVGDVLRALADYPPDRPLFWIAVVLAFVVFAKSLPRERFVLIAVCVQILFYIGAFIVTPNDLRWHLANSWLRLLDHVAVLLGFTALLVTGRLFWVESGILWTVVVESGTNASLQSGNRGTQRPDGAQPRKDRREGPPQGPGEFPQDH